MRHAWILASFGAVASMALALTAQAAARGGNGVGPDPDGDGNPATNTRGFIRIGDAAEAAFDPPYRVITFEAPPGAHNEPLKTQYADKFGVSFGTGVRRQICGNRYFQYDTQCTYLRAPSGRFAALYRHDWGAPMTVKFAKPVCVAATAIYPTGGKQGEAFKVTLEPFAADGTALPKSVMRFTWEENTFRWRLMAGVYMLKERATSVKVRVDSVDEPKKAVRFLMDDLAFIDTGCEDALVKIQATEKASGS
jgi:hypothetical protein